MTEPTEAMIMPPTMNTGHRRATPHRKPWAVPIQPMIGRTTRPGSTNRAPIEKPTDRARGGMASDRLARTPGPTMASPATVMALATMATARTGDQANSNPAKAENQAATAMNRKTPDGPFVASSFTPQRAPTVSPTSSTSCTGTAIQARSHSSRPKISS